MYCFIIISIVYGKCNVLPWGDKLKEKAKVFSNGIFDYEQPFICLSEEKINIKVEVGKVYEGSFTITNHANLPMKGYLFSSDTRLTLQNNYFEGIENIITYQYKASYGEPTSEPIEGEITIVSDCGEEVLPFSVSIEVPYCMTSLGKIRDLNEFADLARMDWVEAKKVFRSRDFEDVFLKDNEEYILCYRSLLKSISISQALEEFLIITRKKPAIQLSIDKSTLEYTITGESFMDKISLKKDHWGYAEIRVSTDAPFIQLEQKFVWADRFIGNSHQISFLIDAAKLRTGNNYGRIYIKTVHQTLTVNLVCIYDNHKEESDRTKLRNISIVLTRNYLKFRLNRINRNEYIEKTNKALRNLSEEDKILHTLMRIHIELISGNNKSAGELLEELAKEEINLRKNHIMEYCAYLYLKSLFYKEDSTTKSYAQMIRKLYENGYYDWKILWFLLYLDKRYENQGANRLADIKEQFELGCRSPIMYYEAIFTYIEEPYLLRELGNFELQVLNFGIKNQIVSRELMNQYTYLAGKRKTFHPLIYKGLVNLYRESKSNAVLSAICSMLIKGFKRKKKYFYWFDLGVKEQLRITELYEYYIYTADDGLTEPLAEPALLYFIYNSSLNDQKKAFLYANIIKNKDRLDNIYRTYYKKMELFAEKQLEAHHINQDLAILYQEFMDKKKGDLMEHLPYVLYKHEIRCNNTNIVGVVVLHKENAVEDYQPMNDGIAVVDIYTDDALIFLVDSNGNRYRNTISYEMISYFPRGKYDYLCLEHSNHPMLLTHLFHHIHSNRIVNEKDLFIRHQALELKNLQQGYRFDCIYSLIDFYYENFDEARLDFYLEEVDLSMAKQKERVKLMEYLAKRSRYDKLLQGISLYGFELLSINHLVRLCSRWLYSHGEKEENNIMVSLCHYCFTQGKYDERILNYLVLYFKGSSSQMTHLWKQAKAFSIPTGELEERLLYQILYTQQLDHDSFDIFLSYYEGVANHELVRAFLSFSAYRYLVHDQRIADQLFPIMRHEILYEENEICLLAWMKYSSDKRDISEMDADYISYHMDRLIKIGIILPFFQKFKERISVSKELEDKFFVEYKANPNNPVYIHYRILKNDGTGEFKSELMPNLYLGIRVKGFILFYHETLEYYITEEIDGRVESTEKKQYRYDITMENDEESQWNQINKMLRAMEKNRDEDLLDLMKQYARADYKYSKCFQPIKENQWY